MTTLKNLDSQLSIVQIRETAEFLGELSEKGLTVLNLVEQHENIIKDLEKTIKRLEGERDQTAKDLATEKETLQALRTVISAEQEKHREQVASFQAELSEARNTIAEAQRVRKEFADLRKKYADVPAS